MKLTGHKLSAYFYTITRGVLLIICITLCLNCEFDPVEPSFGYIYINSANLEATIDQGQATNQITEAWVAVNDRDFGVYQIPGIVPIPSGEEIDITIFPGIRKNDRIRESTIYPFYQEINLSKNITSNKTDTIELTFHYKQNIVFEFMENFESGNGFLDNLDTSNLSVAALKTINTTQNMHGIFDGKFELNEFQDRILLGHKIWTSDLKMGTTPVYLEMDSKADLIFSLLLRGIKNGQGKSPDEIARIFPAENNLWKKTYFDLRELINTRRYDTYQLIIFTAFEPTEELKNVEFLIDNIKILHL